MPTTHSPGLTIAGQPVPTAPAELDPRSVLGQRYQRLQRRRAAGLDPETTEERSRLRRRLEDYQAIIRAAGPWSDHAGLAAAQAGLPHVERTLNEIEQQLRDMRADQSQAEATWAEEWAKYRRLVSDCEHASLAGEHNRAADLATQISGLV